MDAAADEPRGVVRVLAGIRHQVGGRARDDRHQRHVRAAGQTAALTGEGPEGIVEPGRRLDVHGQRRATPLLQMAARARRPPGQGDAGVEIVRILHRPRAEDAVGVDDRVGLRPANLLAGLRRGIREVGRAGIGRLAPSTT